MRQELRDRIIAYNKLVAQKTEKAADLDVIVSAITDLPPGQLKKILTEEILSVLAKYGVVINE